MDAVNPNFTELKGLVSHFDKSDLTKQVNCIRIASSSAVEYQLRTMYSKVEMKEVGSGICWIRASGYMAPGGINELAEFLTNEKLADRMSQLGYQEVDAIRLIVKNRPFIYAD